MYLCQLEIFRIQRFDYILMMVFAYFQGGNNIDPNESFAWKDSTLDRKLKELEERAKKQSELRPVDENGFDKNIDKSIGHWSSLPKAPNPDVILLQRARGQSDRISYFFSATHQDYKRSEYQNFTYLILSGASQISKLQAVPHLS